MNYFLTQIFLYLNPVDLNSVDLNHPHLIVDYHHQNFHQIILVYLSCWEVLLNFHHIPINQIPSLRNTLNH